eukprot:6636813-Prymnesium_polylepis.1
MARDGTWSHVTERNGLSTFASVVHRLSRLFTVTAARIAGDEQYPFSAPGDRRTAVTAPFLRSHEEIHYSARRLSMCRADAADS